MPCFTGIDNMAVTNVPILKAELKLRAMECRMFREVTK